MKPTIRRTILALTVLASCTFAAPSATADTWPPSACQSFYAAYGFYPAGACDSFNGAPTTTTTVQPTTTTTTAPPATTTTVRCRANGVDGGVTTTCP